MVDGESHRAAVEAGYASLSGYVKQTPHAMPIEHNVFEAMKKAADGNAMSPADQINLALRQWLGWER